MLAHLRRWVDAGWVRELDHAFAAFLAREAPGAHPLLLLAAALASHQLGRGHACLELQATLADAGATLALPPEQQPERDAPQQSPAADPAELLRDVTLAGWQEALHHPLLVSEGEGTTPLVLQEGRLYLRRYWAYEQAVRHGLRERLGDAAQPALAASTELAATLDALFGKGTDFDWQKAACALAARSKFAVITGGPGTGKTTTVVKLLALLQHLALQGDLPGRAPGRPLRMGLAAPTGKAAARLNESIAGAVDALPFHALASGEQMRTVIPTRVSTVHRLLGAMPDSRHFRHGPTHPLPLDVVVLDEASMVDLEMMAAVLGALPAEARLVLLGDKDQLASVEAGAVLGALCQRADAGHYTPQTCEWLRQVTGHAVPSDLVDEAGEPLDQAVAKLRRSWRFSDASGIGQLAAAVNTGSVDAVKRLAAKPLADLAFVDVAGSAALEQLVLRGGPRADLVGPAGYLHYLQVLRESHPAHGAMPQDLDRWALQVLRAYGEFQLLCAVRQGPWGVHHLNRRVAHLLHRSGATPSADGWYLGRPVMVVRNDYSLGLMNGDVGVTLEWPQPDGTWKLRVAFASADAASGVRWVLPSRLQEVETVYAMTVHKSQGSEFRHAALLLPEQDSRVLSRELVYTGITRAKEWFTLATSGQRELLAAAVTRRLRRAGGTLQ